MQKIKQKQDENQYRQRNVELVEKFRHLGSLITTDGKSFKDIEQKIAQGEQAFVEYPL